MLKLVLFFGVTLVLTLLGLSLKRVAARGNKKPLTSPPVPAAMPARTPSSSPQQSTHQGLWSKVKESGRSHAAEIIASLIALTAGLLFLRAGSRSLYDALVGSASFWFLLFVVIFIAATSSIGSESMKAVKKFLIVLLVVCVAFEWFHLIPDTARHWGETRTLLTPSNPVASVEIPVYHHLEWWGNKSKLITEKHQSGQYVVRTFQIQDGVDSVWVTTRVREGLAPE